MQKTGKKIELGLVQDIDADISTVTASISTVRKALLQAESLMGKNVEVLKTIGQAITRVENVSKEIGADSIMKEAQKRADIHKNITNTVNKSLSQIGSAISNL